MKQKFLYGMLFALVVFSASCNKNNNIATGDSYIKFKMNGTWVTYKAALGELGPDLGDPSKMDLGLTAYSDDQAEMFDFTIQMSGNNIPAGVYSSDNPGYVTRVNMMTGLRTGNFRMYENFSAPTGSPSKYVITISAITENQIRGSFTGNYLYDDINSTGASTDIIEITEGEFKVERIR